MGTLINSDPIKKSTGNLKSTLSLKVVAKHSVSYSEKQSCMFCSSVFTG